MSNPWITGVCVRCGIGNKKISPKKGLCHACSYVMSATEFDAHSCSHLDLAITEQGVRYQIQCPILLPNESDWCELHKPIPIQLPLQVRVF